MLLVRFRDRNPQLAFEMLESDVRILAANALFSILYLKIDLWCASMYLGEKAHFNLSPSLSRNHCKAGEMLSAKMPFT